MTRPDVDAVVLVGGQGTRLRPLTQTVAKPLLPTAGVPFLEHLLSRIRTAGITHVVLATSYRAETFTEYFGNGSAFGLQIEYVLEDEPLGTGGAIRNVVGRLRGRTVLVFNGDVLSGVELPQLLAAHEKRNADVTLHLVKAADPRAFGCVPTDPNGWVESFLEKADDPPTDQINAGCYVFRRSVLELIPAGRYVSVERETFPGLLAAGLKIFGYVDSSYWLDLGTPAAFVRGCADLVTGTAPTNALPGQTGDALLLPRARVAGSAIITGGSTVGRVARVADRAVVDTSVLFDGAVIGAAARVVRSVVGRGARVGEGALLRDAVIGDGAEIGDRCELDGTRVWPKVRLSAGHVRCHDQTLKEDTEMIASRSASTVAPRLADFVKAYDVRGVVGEQLTQDVARAVGRAFARFVNEEGIPGGGSAVVLGHDMRDSSPHLSHAFAEGVTAAGLDVVWVGLASTDMLYFASGTLGLPGAMFTASHNPARYNGIKLCRAGALPISLDSGLARVRDDAQALLEGPLDQPVVPAGTVMERNLLDEYAAYLGSLVDLSGIRPLHVVVDAGNGMAGHTVPAVLGPSPLRLTPMYFELDGTFPNHEANPLEPANLVDLQAEVRRRGADLGLAFDGDADRCFVVDERGEPVPPSSVTGLVATRELARRPGATVLYNLISSRAVPEVVGEAGGRPVRTRVGHSFIKAEMAATGAVFGGEHSAHYYFADFFGADTGMLAALHVLAALGSQDRPLSELLSRFDRYVGSGEINSVVADVPGKLDEIRAWAALHGAQVDELDGVTVDLGEGRWFNVRPSNTEPLLRLNVEARTRDAMSALRDDILGLIRADISS